MDLWPVVEYLCDVRPNNVKTGPTPGDISNISLPWPTVRAAWVSTMHQVEEGHLSWAYSTQFAINRLSPSQAAVAHSQVTTASALPKRPFKYFNEGSCSHEGHPGNNSHFCSHCMKQGKTLNHLETRSNNKQRQTGRQQQNAS